MILLYSFGGHPGLVKRFVLDDNSISIYGYGDVLQTHMFAYEGENPWFYEAYRSENSIEYFFFYN